KFSYVKIWMCTLTESQDFMTKHLKKELLFKELVDQAAHDQPKYLQKTLLEFEDVFSGVTGMPPPCSTDHKIDLVKDAEPLKHWTYHMSEEVLKLLREELDRLVALGHIHPSISPFGAPVFFVKNANGKIHMVMDYCALNKLTIKNGTELPNILEL